MVGNCEIGENNKCITEQFFCKWWPLWLLVMVGRATSFMQSLITLLTHYSGILHTQYTSSLSTRHKKVIYFIVSWGFGRSCSWSTHATEFFLSAVLSMTWISLFWIVSELSCKRDSHAGKTWMQQLQASSKCVKINSTTISLLAV